MLPLESPLWSTLTHAYGKADDIPDLIRQLEGLPEFVDFKSEPYYSLSSALCHQGDVYTASYAAVPHFVRILAENPANAPWALYSLPGAIEQCRLAGRAPDIPAPLSESYFSALAQIPGIAAVAAQAPWDELRCRVILATIAVAKGQPGLSEAIDMLTPAAIKRLLDE
jgi:hypothetical protein